MLIGKMESTQLPKLSSADVKDAGGANPFSKGSSGLTAAVVFIHEHPINVAWTFQCS